MGVPGQVEAPHSSAYDLLWIVRQHGQVVTCRIGAAGGQLNSELALLPGSTTLGKASDVNNEALLNILS
ncbi:hypothetical protein PG990_006925 [Apiospora arundinis]